MASSVYKIRKPRRFLCAAIEKASLLWVAVGALYVAAQDQVAPIADQLRQVAPSAELSVGASLPPVLTRNPLFGSVQTPQSAVVKDVNLSAARLAAESFNLTRQRQEVSDRLRLVEQAKADKLTLENTLTRLPFFAIEERNLAQQQVAQTTQRLTILQSDLAASQQRESAAAAAVDQVRATLSTATAALQGAEELAGKGLLHEQGRLLIKFTKGAVAEQIRELLVRYQLAIIRTIPDLGIANVSLPSTVSSGNATAGVPGEPGRIVRTPPEDLVQLQVTMERLRFEPIVEVVCPNLTVTAQLTRRAPARPQKPPAAQTLMKQDRAWALKERFVQGVTIGVVDEGFMDHNAVPARRSAASLCADSATDTARQHGTAVVGIIAALPDGQHAGGWAWPVSALPRRNGKNALDLVTCAAFGAEYAIAPSESMSLALHVAFDRILDTVRSLVRAERDLRVVNISLAYNWHSAGVDPRSANGAAVIDGAGRMWRGLVDLAERALFVCAAGNDGPLSADRGSPCAYPPSSERPRVIVVQSIDENGQVAPESNRNGDISAPGEEIITTGIANGYATFSGTSAAAPQITGLAALIFAANPTLTPEEVKDLLLRQVKTLPSGQKVPDAEACIRAAIASKHQP